ncbi:MCE family protein [Gordonia desulfuricans]|uniref:MCE family protein n=1 Tax=Gordonia desulfuricans TaxID=89051 RepID=A0A7K3LJ79_9ACTN|nr:MCE family protein [Gordonia desulfuricans]NDK88248.1 MCE family protein [Gordonia desulfuricans]
MSRRQERSVGVRRLAAVIMVGVLVALVVGASAQFLGWFASTERVTLQAPRAGLVMSPDAKVRLRGVQVGKVASITENGEQAVLELDIDSGQMSQIPGNVTAQIKSNTVFGAKSVYFEVPDNKPSGTLQPGQVIGAEHVVVELNTVYQQLVSVLATLQPEKLNATVGALTTALDGRGEQLGRSLEDLHELLGKTNPHLPELNELIRQTAATTDVYGDVVDDLMRTVDNAVYTGNTLRANASNFASLLLNVTSMADTINNDVVAPSKKDLMATLTQFDPVSQLLGYQAPGIACFLRTSAVASDIAKPYMGGRNGTLLLYAGLLPGKEPYTYPQSLPRVNADGPPTCAGGLSDPTTTAHSDFYVTDNAPTPYQPRTTPKFDRTKLFQLLFGEPKLG